MADSDVAAARSVTGFEDMNDEFRYHRDKMRADQEFRVYNHTCWRHVPRNLNTWIYYPTQCPGYCVSGTSSLRHHLNDMEIALLSPSFFLKPIDMSLDVIRTLNDEDLATLAKVESELTPGAKDVMVGLGYDTNVALSQSALVLIRGYYYDKGRKVVSIEEIAHSTVDGAIVEVIYPPMENVDVDHLHLVSDDDVHVQTSCSSVGRSIVRDGRVPLNEYRFWFDRSYYSKIAQFSNALEYRPSNVLGVSIELAKTYAFTDGLDLRASSLSMVALCLNNLPVCYFTGRDNPYGTWSTLYGKVRLRAFSVYLKIRNESDVPLKMFCGIKGVDAQIKVTNCTDYRAVRVSPGQWNSLYLRRMAYQFPGYAPSDIYCSKLFQESEPVVLFGVTSHNGDCSGARLELRLELVLDFSDYLL